MDCEYIISQYDFGDGALVWDGEPFTASKLYGNTGISQNKHNIKKNSVSSNDHAIMKECAHNRTNTEALENKCCYAQQLPEELNAISSTYIQQKYTNCVDDSSEDSVCNLSFSKPNVRSDTKLLYHDQSYCLYNNILMEHNYFTCDRSDVKESCSYDDLVKLT